jgi:diamine N-acetyltransferase
MIFGSLVSLRPARESDRRNVYEWLARSDVTPSMMGPPLYAEAPIPSWEEFCNDYVTLFFDGTAPHVGRSYVIERDGAAVGHVSYSQVDLDQGQAELDIWLRGEAECGKGYGPDALAALTRHLHETLRLKTFILRPSLRNVRAIAAYAKAGFELLPASPKEQAALYGSTEHYDTAVMRLNLGAMPCGGTMNP